MITRIKEDVVKEKAPRFIIHDDSILCFQGCLYVPNNEVLRRGILQEAYAMPYTVHRRMSKMYKDLKRNFWWHNMKKKVDEFIMKCLTCQQVKIEHQRSTGLLEPLPIME